jgi:hypothetical protein
VDARLTTNVAVLLHPSFHFRVCDLTSSHHRNTISDESTIKDTQTSVSAIGTLGVHKDEKSRVQDPVEGTALGRALAILKKENKRLNELLLASEDRCRGNIQFNHCF